MSPVYDDWSDESSKERILMPIILFPTMTKKMSVFCGIFIAFSCVAAGCQQTPTSQPVQPVPPVSPPASSSTSVVPPGWTTLVDEKDGLKAVVPTSLEYYGCSQPTALKVVDGNFSLGALWTPCLPPAGQEKAFLDAHDDIPTLAIFEDTFSGYVINVEKNIATAADATSAVEKRWKDCKLNVTDWSANKWNITASRAPETQYAPSPCGLIHDNDPVHGFYNAKTKTFVYWLQTKNQFSVNKDQYADDQVQILPTDAATTSK
jgi:hypothetical protein